MEKTLFWDFFGPNAAPTADHFKRHLDEFLARSGCAVSETGRSSAGAGHQAVFCRLDEAASGAVSRALKPRREE